jgi:hypothetical protein
MKGGVTSVNDPVSREHPSASTSDENVAQIRNLFVKMVHHYPQLG